MLAASSVLQTLPHIETVRSCYIAVTAAGTAGSLVMDPQLDIAQRALSLDHGGDRAFGLGLESVVHRE